MENLTKPYLYLLISGVICVDLFIPFYFIYFILLLQTNRNKGGGGVALYVKDTLKVKVLARSDTTGPCKPKVSEYLACQIWEGEVPPVLIAVIHRPPKIAFEQKLQSLLQKLCPDIR